MTLDAFVAHAGATSTVVQVAGEPWQLSGRRLGPLAPPHRPPAASAEAVRRALAGTGALVASWNDGWDTPPLPWWWVCCDDPGYDVEGLPRNARRDVRAGLRRCEVRRVEPAELAEGGFAVYRAAFERYDVHVTALTAEGFAAEVRRNAAYPGRESWGAFADGRMVAWASCIVVDDVVLLASAKSDPAHLKAMPNNAIAYELARHYLRDRRMRYVTDGSRTVAHDTRYQDFLLRMGWRKVFCPLRLVLSPAARLAARSGADRWGRLLLLHRLAPVPFARVEALAAMDRIARECAVAGAPVPTP
ncbi:MAG: hypothetical protein FJ087_11050 [Deltaproteobacteria bacterium]|nr:hypothetical protein [Deltaproteobacteria bacterium]